MFYKKRHAPESVPPLTMKADNGSRTRLSGLGSRRSTDEPYLHGNHYSTLTLKFKLKFN